MGKVEEMHEYTQTTECREEIFFQHIGMDRKNLQQLVKIEKPFKELAEQEYRWKDIFGNNPSIDLELHMKDSVSSMRSRFREVAEDIIKKIEEYLPQELSRVSDQTLYHSLMNINNPNGLIRMMEKELYEKEKDHIDLLHINKDTYSRIQEEKEIRGQRTIINQMIGHRAIWELLEAVDDFLRQRYEICRCEVMIDIYKTIIEKVVKGMEKLNEERENERD